jgi:predicted transcriptional regulator
VLEHEASRSEVRHVLNRFFGNSRERLLLSLLDDQEISADELERLKELIRNAAPDAVDAIGAAAIRSTGAVRQEGKKA